MLTNTAYSDTPFEARRAMYQSMAKIVVEARGKPGFERFVEERSEDTAIKLYALLQPTMHGGTSVELAWRDLRKLMAVGHGLGVSMCAVPYSFHIRFPPAGAPFDPSCMVSHDPLVREDPVALQKRGARLKLGVTPLIKKDEFRDAATGPQTIHYAKVLLMA